ncbi:hypothetical protein BDK51DRAFT_33440 [Blyttiomyces helicus]|uniref:Uncharacterized protein n=1 Tax=Blyttiomyces helicus TaxID=388810 RepID=A0A4P9WEU9_9FUNG|nr:hypothetical protein BDK51DRAFT_33440 [Blyttiomyces helicus]|eukprot:RKO90243.1 hypothetical protein BDK51DRAFT_33440 [Blyttiomyces helicus]
MDGSKGKGRVGGSWERARLMKLYEMMEWREGRGSLRSVQSPETPTLGCLAHRTQREASSQLLSSITQNHSPHRPCNPPPNPMDTPDGSRSENPSAAFISTDPLEPSPPPTAPSTAPPPDDRPNLDSAASTTTTEEPLPSSAEPPPAEPASDPTEVAEQAVIEEEDSAPVVTFQDGEATSAVASGDVEVPPPESAPIADPPTEEDHRAALTLQRAWRGYRGIPPPSGDAVAPDVGAPADPAPEPSAMEQEPGPDGVVPVHRVDEEVEQAVVSDIGVQGGGGVGDPGDDVRIADGSDKIMEIGLPPLPGEGGGAQFMLRNLLEEEMIPATEEELEMGNPGILELTPRLASEEEEEEEEKEEEEEASNSPIPPDVIKSNLNSWFRKKYIGGFRHRKSKTEYFHASTQTPTPQEIKALNARPKFHRDSQTKFIHHRKSQCVVEAFTQMTKPGCYVTTEADVLLPVRRYVSADEHEAWIISNVVRIQCFVRCCYARRLITQLRKEKVARLKALSERRLGDDRDLSLPTLGFVWVSINYILNQVYGAIRWTIEKLAVGIPHVLCAAIRFFGALINGISRVSRRLFTPASSCLTERLRAPQHEHDLHGRQYPLSGDTIDSDDESVLSDVPVETFMQFRDATGFFAVEDAEAAGKEGARHCFYVGECREGVQGAYAADIVLAAEIKGIIKEALEKDTMKRGLDPLADTIRKRWTDTDGGHSGGSTKHTASRRTICGSSV